MTLSIFIRRLLLCWWGGCFGKVDHDDIGVHFKCLKCGRITP